MIKEAGYTKDSFIRNKSNDIINSLDFSNARIYNNSLILPIYADLILIFSEEKHSHSALIQKTKGKFYIKVFNCIIDTDEYPYTVVYDKTSLIHELIHYFDFIQSNNNLTPPNTTTQKTYINNSYELNSFFQQYFTNFEERITNPPKDFKGFVELFLDTPLKDNNELSSYKNEVFNHLTKTNKERIIKRLFINFKKYN